MAKWRSALSYRFEIADRRGKGAVGKMAFGPGEQRLRIVGLRTAARFDGFSGAFVVDPILTGVVYRQGARGVQTWRFGHFRAAGARSLLMGRRRLACGLGLDRLIG